MHAANNNVFTAVDESGNVVQKRGRDAAGCKQMWKRAKAAPDVQRTLTDTSPALGADPSPDLDTTAERRSCSSSRQWVEICSKKGDDSTMHTTTCIAAAPVIVGGDSESSARMPSTRPAQANRIALAGAQRREHVASEAAVGR